MDVSFLISDLCVRDPDMQQRSVEDVRGDPITWTIELSVHPISMQSMGRSCSIKYNHGGYRTWNARDVLQLHARDEHVDTDTYSLGYNPEVPSRLPIFPPSNLTAVDDAVQT